MHAVDGASGCMLLGATPRGLGNKPQVLGRVLSMSSLQPDAYAGSATPRAAPPSLAVRCAHCCSAPSAPYLRRFREPGHSIRFIRVEA